MSDKPCLELGTGFGSNAATEEFFNQLEKKGVIRSMGRMIPGATLRIGEEEIDVTDMSVDAVRDLLSSKGISF